MPRDALSDIVMGLSRLKETTRLSPQEEYMFQQWARDNGIADINSPKSRYDYRGYWKALRNSERVRFGVDHFPDTYKQHGHPTFSAESQYSRGLWDGGQWIGDTLIDPPLPSHHRGH